MVWPVPIGGFFGYYDNYKEAQQRAATQLEQEMRVEQQMRALACCWARAQPPSLTFGSSAGGDIAFTADGTDEINFSMVLGNSNDWVAERQEIAIKRVETSFTTFYRNLKKEINDWLDLGDL